MLSKWRQRRKPVSEGKTRAKVRLLEFLAYHFSHQGKELFSADELYDQIEEYLQGGRVPTVFRTVNTDDLITELSEDDGILQKLDREGNRYLFLHRTFQEYFTAKRFCNQSNWQGLVSYITEPHWKEIFLLTVEMLDSADNLLQLMKCQIDALLVEDDKLQQALIWLSKKCNYVPAPYYVDTVPDKPIAVRAFYFDLFIALILDDFHLATIRTSEHSGKSCPLARTPSTNWF